MSGKELKEGDGVETPVLYCDDCGVGWDTPEEAESEGRQNLILGG